jgi:hypothetical protein
MSTNDAVNVSLRIIVMQVARLHILGIIEIFARTNVIRFLKVIPQTGGAKKLKTTSFHRLFSVQISYPMFLNQSNII